jgi:hypothetical protein
VGKPVAQSRQQKDAGYSFPDAIEALEEDARLKKLVPVFLA